MKSFSKYRNLLFLSLLLNGGGILYAQIPNRPDSSKIHITREEVFVDPSVQKGKESSFQSRPEPKLKWAAKLNPIVLSRGELPVYIERRLNSSFSAELGAGITFRDFFKETILEGKPLFQKDPTVDNLSGLTGKLALRYFPFHSAFSGIYLSPEADAKNYRKDVNGVYMGSDGRYTEGKLRDQQKYLDLKGVVGFQNTDDYGNDFYLDWYLGIGVRMGTEDNVVPDEKNANVIKSTHANIMIPIISLGLKIGLGF
jgi:hypothetical protein